VNGDATRPILIVEDDLDIRDALQEILEDEGYEACAAANGAEAFELLNRVQKPGLVLLDLMMPVMDGYQFLEIFRAKPQFADIPVVVVTAGILVVPGIAGFIKKPFDTDQLLRMVNKLFPAPRFTNGGDARSAPG
jgi:CheY-like chemotaxis protein